MIQYLYPLLLVVAGSSFTLWMAYLFAERTHVRNDIQNDLLAQETRTALDEIRLRVSGSLDTVNKINTDISSIESEFARVSALLDQDELTKILNRVGELELMVGFNRQKRRDV